jgi:hypothetical protein
MRSRVMPRAALPRPIPVVGAPDGAGHRSNAVSRSRYGLRVAVRRESAQTLIRDVGTVGRLEFPAGEGRFSLFCALRCPWVHHVVLDDCQSGRLSTERIAA